MSFTENVPENNAARPVRKWTRNWTRKCIEHWREHLMPLVGVKPLTYLEIGVFEGRSAAWILENVLIGINDRYFGIDPWELSNMSARRFPRNAVGERQIRAVESRARFVLKRFGAKATLIKGDSGAVLRDREWLDRLGKIDVAYIDGDHDLQAVFDDSLLVWPLLSAGGIAIWDDYVAKSSNQVQIGVQQFLQTVRGNYDLLFADHQFGVRKTQP